MKLWVFLMSLAIALTIGCSDKPQQEAQEKGQGKETASPKNEHSQASTGADEHSQASTGADEHSQASTGADEHSQASTGADEHSQASADANSHSRENTTDEHAPVNENSKYPDRRDVARADALAGFSRMGLNIQGYFEYEHIKTGIVFVLIPSGSFLMGTGSDEKYGEPEERPRHSVTLDAFLIARYELTQEQWHLIMESTPWQGGKYIQNDPKGPACDLTWEDCSRFCKKTGLDLPTEAQWEKACRGGSETRNYWGESLKPAEIDKYAWYSGNADQANQRYPHQVGQKAPNQFGIYDSIGNVYEACSDWYDEDYYQKSPRRNPTGPTDGEYRVYRGGSWSSDERFCRASYRFWAAPEYRSGMGMRPAKSF